MSLEDTKPESRAGLMLCPSITSSVDKAVSFVYLSSNQVVVLHFELRVEKYIACLSTTLPAIRGILWELYIICPCHAQPKI